MDDRTKTELQNLRRRENDLQNKYDAVDKRGKELTNPTVTYNCPYCNKSFKSLSALQAHMKVHGTVGAEGGKEDKYNFGESYDETQKKLKDIDTEANVFGDTVDSVGNKISTLKSFITDAVEHGVSIDNPKLQKMIGLYQELSDSIKTVDDLIDTTDAEEANNGEDDKLKYWEDRAKEQETAADALVDATEKLAEANGTAAPEWEKYAKSLEDMASAEGVLPETAKALRDAAKAWREFNQAQEDAAWGTQTNIGGGYVNPDRYIAIDTDEAGQQEYLDDENDFLADALEAAQRTGQDMKEALGDGLCAAVSAKWDDLGDAAKNLFQNLLREATQLVTNQIWRQLMQTAFGTWLNSTYGTGSRSVAGVAFAGALAGAKASGGPVSAFAPYLVGENGPEVFVPNSNGGIVSNDKLGALSPKVQFNMINQTGMPVQVEQKSMDVDVDGVIIGAVMRGYANDKGGIRTLFNNGRK
jgi:hypothetical protein